jgi:hypothetical protein
MCARPAKFSKFGRHQADSSLAMETQQSERTSAMEIQTTVKAFSERIDTLGICPETPIRVTIGDSPKTEDSNGGKIRLPFLHSGVWDDLDGPADISENTDHYLYDSGDIHGR